MPGTLASRSHEPYGRPGRRWLATALLLAWSSVPAQEAPPSAQAQGAGGSSGEAPPPIFERVIAKARELAEVPYQDAEPIPLPDPLADLSYQGYRAIRFDKDQALWRDQAAYNVEFFHPGFLYRRTVAVHEVVNGEVRTVPFSTDMFTYGDQAKLDGALPADLGFAGFRLHYPLHSADYKDEIITFLGAAYSRMVGRQQHYGLSMRGIAIDTALPSGEEFPSFTEFWLERPAPESNRVRFYALLESDSLTGAYAFELTSRAQTVLDVQARLFARKDVAKLGVAPLTSMFAWGENAVRLHDDYRPEVHDSDGLVQHTANGEWIWRPLVNPPSLQVSELLDSDPRGFGLAQRDREFDHYQDPEAHYERRPGIWVTPGEGDWERGAVQLIEIPSPEETNDNIVAFWVNARPFNAGESRSFSYRMRTFDAQHNPDGLAIVTDTRIGWGAVPGAPDKPPRSVRQFTVDFAGGELEGLAADQPIEPDLTVNNGVARDVSVQRLPGEAAWRVAFKLHPEDQDRLVNMRLILELRDNRISETWNYLWDPATVN